MTVTYFLRGKIGGIFLETKIQFNRAGFGIGVSEIGPRGDSMSVLGGQGTGKKRP